MKSLWLEKLVQEAVRQHHFDEKAFVASSAILLPQGPARARRYVRSILRETGLIYGTPFRSASGAPTDAEEILFREVLRTLCRIALDLTFLANAAPGPRAEQLLLLLCATFGEREVAHDIHKRIERATRQWPLPAKIWVDTQSMLEERSVSLSGDPYYGLVLHNGALYADASLFCRIALAYFRTQRFEKEQTEKRVFFASAQKALLVRVLVSLSCSERAPHFTQRRAIHRQIEDLRLPEELEKQTQEFVDRCFEKPPPIKKVLAQVKSLDMKRFILEQTLLAALVEGRATKAEGQFIHQLGSVLGFNEMQIDAVRLSVANFYAQRRDVVDVFTVGPGAQMLGDELVGAMQHKFLKHYRALLKQVKKTGELSVLLAKLARGEKLSGVEKKKMREQLIEVAKAIPALAIFAAPGGIIILAALAKVLPNKYLPELMQDPDLNEATGTSIVALKPDVEK